MIVGPRNKLYRASCNGVEIGLRVEPDVAWLTIKRPGEERQYRYIPGVVERFEAIGEDPEKVFWPVVEDLIVDGTAFVGEPTC